MSARKQRILVLGSGFAAYRFILGINTRLFDVTMISPRNHFLFTPLLASTTVGTIEFRSVIEPMRGVRHGIEFYEARCRAIEHEKKVVHCEQVDTGKRFALAYDVLVIAVGATNNTFGVAGVEQFAHFLREVSDARAIRHKILSLFAQASAPGVGDEEQRRLLHFVVVGGGPTGVEFAAELHDFWVGDLRRLYAPLANKVSIVLLEARERILNTFDDRLGEYTMRSFQRRSIVVKTNSTVKEVQSQRVILADGSEVPFGLLVWSAGNSPTSFVNSVDLFKDRNGRLLTDWMLRVVGHEEIYALGDCAVIGEENMPATAQVAQQQGKYLARALAKRVSGGQVRPFSYRHLGMLAYIGGNTALADLPGLKMTGFTAWLFWRSIYVTKLVSTKNKILVLFDWIKTRVFGRDISRF